ncbi:hypothetical protein M422DRAFT_255513 [Sphaerobolus stellatus SS14]|uniref:Lactate/malate dehydrogenase C-terminal domain-containing protein n=1 Tax=Sphaerobolus stellatus (strain SS14) TaxID=990650 RepID=A0A0C9V3U3_SPHS4|nr:hypothetical protein M422DRAFT_255513 [Sphaerobolus stellatus SS14]
MSFAAIFGTFKISDSKINNLQPTSYVIYQVVLFSEAIGSIPSFIRLETTPEYRVIPNTTPVFVYGRISGPHLGPFYIDAIKIYPLLGPFTMPSYEPQISIVPYFCVIGHIPGGVTSMHESTHVFKMMSTSWAMTLFDPLITRSAVARRLPGDCSMFVVGPFTFEGGHERPYLSPMANTQGRPYNPFRHGTIGPGSFRERFHAANFRFTPFVPRAEVRGGDEVVQAKDSVGSATLSMAYAALLLRALKGEAGIVTPTFVKSPLFAAQGIEFFLSAVKLGPNGVAKIHDLGNITAQEQELVNAALPELKKNIEKGFASV